jgi:hypothetical protein
MKQYLHPGEENRADGWIYKKGKPDRKWFDQIQGIWIWEPKLKNIPALEEKYWKMVQYARKFHEECWHPAAQALIAVGEAHAQIDHQYVGQIPPWWLYKANEEGSIGFEWVDEPENPINLKIGQAFYQLENKAKQVYGRKWKFKVVFERALEKWIFKEVGYPKCGEQTLRVTINNRIYWFCSRLNRHGIAVWEKLAWAEDHVEDLTIS